MVFKLKPSHDVKEARTAVKARAKAFREWIVSRRNRKLKKRLVLSDGSSSLTLPSPKRSAAISKTISKRVFSEIRSPRKVVDSTAFPGTIIIEDKEAAIRHAKDECKSEPKAHRLVLWTDGSFHRHNRKGGVAVVFKGGSSSDWKIKAFTLGVGRSDETELFALSAAMQIAWEERTASAEDNQFRLEVSEVVIYSDAQECIRMIRHHGERNRNRWTPFRAFLFRKIDEYADALTKLRVRVQISWVPGHSSVPGNVAADAVAKQAARKCQPIPNAKYVTFAETDPWAR